MRPDARLKIFRTVLELEGARVVFRTTSFSNVRCRRKG